MQFEDRQYQLETADAMWEAIQDPECKPVVAVPTGAGKTVIMGLFFKRYLKVFPDNQILVLSHTKRILEQDTRALESFFPDVEIGVYSAGLNRKEHRQITVGGIQSVIKNPNLFRWTNLVLVDEVHSVSHKAEGSYRKLLDGMFATITGMSATVFRTGHGYIYEGKGTIFNTLAYDLTSVKNYNKLVEDGYIAPLIAVAPETQLDSTKVKKSAGDYNVKQLSETHDKKVITDAAIQDALYYGKNYSHWLVFAIDIEHAEHINESLNDRGINSGVLHSRINGDEDEILKDFDTGKIRALVSVGMITTGFDSPHVDLILMLRPTMSAVLHVQMAGRGTRIHTGKKHCLYLDYAGNTGRLGPINNVIVPKQAKEDGTGEAPTKTCPICSTITYTRAKVCDSCGHEFVFETNLVTLAGTADIVEGDHAQPAKDKWLTVTRVMYAIHRKPGAPDSLLVTYHCGLTRVKEWWCINHRGFAGRKAQSMVQYRSYRGPMDTHSVYKARATLDVPKQILVDFSAKFPNILNARF